MTQPYRPGDPSETNANIMGQNTGNARLVIDTSRHGPSWHRLEKLMVIPEGKLGVTAVEALEQAGLDFQVTTVAAPPVMDPFRDGEVLVPSDTVFIVREPLDNDQRSVIFGTATPGWKPIQNRQIAELLDATGLIKKHPVETMGALGQGETFFASLYGGTKDISGEEYSRFVGLTDGKAANRSLSLFIGGTRMECQNTVRLATAGAEWTISLRHDDDLAANLKMAMQAIGDVDARFEAYEEALVVLGNKKIASKTVMSILDFAYPEPRKPAKLKIVDQLASLAGMGEADQASVLQAQEKYAAWVRTVEGHKQAAVVRTQVFFEKFPRFANTPYGVLQAVAEVESWRKTNRGGAKGDSNIAEGLLFGDRGNTILRAAVAAQKVSGVDIDPRYRKLAATAPAVRS